MDWEQLPLPGLSRGREVDTLEHKARMTYMNSMRNQNWRTPRVLLEAITEKFGELYLDVCADEENAVCPRFFTAETNGLDVRWPAGLQVFCNPPYRESKVWVAKAMEEAWSQHTTTVLLTKQACDTRWWHDIAGEVTTYLMTPRVHFDPPPGVQDPRRNSYGSMILHIGHPRDIEWGRIRVWRWND
jgi:phage N-6-adenine-methyltransferase